MGSFGERLERLSSQVVAGGLLSRQEAEWMAAEVRGEDLPDLFRGASRIRDHFLGRTVRCCSIVAATVGGCDQDCAFCSQSAHYETHVKGMTELPADEVQRASREAAAVGARCFGIVTSGLGPTEAAIEHWGPTFEKIRAEGRIGVGASMGVLTAAQAKRLADLGVRRYNHNLQTSRRHFPNIVSTHSYDDRLATLRHVRAAGMELCSGALFGMGETWADRLDLAFELRALDPEVVPLNFLIPIAGTPLSGLPPLEAGECLKMIAVYRYVLPRQEIKIAGGRETQLREVQSWIFAAGATGFLVGNYLTTCGGSVEADRQMVRDLGLEIEPFREAVGPAARSRPVCDHRASRPCPSSAVE